MSRSTNAKLLVLLGGIVLSMVTQPLSAQNTNHWSGGLSVGQGAAIGGDRRSGGREQPIADFNLAYRLSSGRFGSPLLGVNYAAELTNGYDLTCIEDRTTGKCVPRYPTLSGFAAFVGWQTPRPERGSLRVVVGPGAFRSGELELMPGRQFGVLSRIEAATPTALSTSVVLSVGTLYLPNVSGTRLRQRRITLGFSIQ